MNLSPNYYLVKISLPAGGQKVQGQPGYIVSVLETSESPSAAEAETGRSL